MSSTGEGLGLRPASATTCSHRLLRVPLHFGPEDFHAAIQGATIHPTALTTPSQPNTHPTPSAARRDQHACKQLCKGGPGLLPPWMPPGGVLGGNGPECPSVALCPHPTHHLLPLTPVHTTLLRLPASPSLTPPGRPGLGLRTPAGLLRGGGLGLGTPYLALPS